MKSKQPTEPIQVEEWAWDTSSEVKAELISRLTHLAGYCRANLIPMVAMFQTAQYPESGVGEVSIDVYNSGSKAVSPEMAQFLHAGVMFSRDLILPEDD